MRLFLNKKLIKTNPNERPKIRFEKVLLHFLQEENYKYLKSKNEFVQDFEFGKRIIKLSYNNSIGYISSVQFFSHIIFINIEEKFSSIFPNYQWTNWTIHYNHHWTENWLCDKKTGKYTDKSINKSSREFFQKIKPEIDKLHFKVKNYQDLDFIYNKTPSEFFDFLPSSRLEKRVINGLILTNTLKKENFNQVKNEYYRLLEKYKGGDKEVIHEEINFGIEKIENENIQIRTNTNIR